MPTVWTCDKINALTALWPSDLSAAQIGATIGVSKHAVCGKAFRLGLPPKDPETVASAARPSPSKAAFVRVPSEEDDDEHPDRSACNRHLADLKLHHPTRRYGGPAPTAFDGLPARISGSRADVSLIGSPAAMAAGI